MANVIPSAEARKMLPALIEHLTENTNETVEIGRQRRGEVVLMSASRFDDLMRREAIIADAASAAFALERIENPTSAPVSWEEAQHRRAERSGGP